MKHLLNFALPVLAICLFACEEADDDAGGGTGGGGNSTDATVLSYKIQSFDVSDAVYIGNSYYTKELPGSVVETAKYPDEGTKYFTTVEKDGYVYKYYERARTVKITADGLVIPLKYNSPTDGKITPSLWYAENMYRLSDNFIMLCTGQHAGGIVDGKEIGGGSVYAGVYIVRLSDGRAFEFNPPELYVDAEGNIHSERKMNDGAGFHEPWFRTEDSFYGNGMFSADKESTRFMRVKLHDSGSPTIETLDEVMSIQSKISPNNQIFYYDSGQYIYDVNYARRYELDDGYNYGSSGSNIDYRTSDGKWYVMSDGSREDPDDEGKYIHFTRISTVDPANNTFEEVLTNDRAFPISETSLYAMDNHFYVTSYSHFYEPDSEYADHYGFFRIEGDSMVEIMENGINHYSQYYLGNNIRWLRDRDDNQWLLDDNRDAASCLIRLYEGNYSEENPYYINDIVVDRDGKIIISANDMEHNIVLGDSALLLTIENGKLTELFRPEGTMIAIIPVR